MKKTYISRFLKFVSLLLPIVIIALSLQYYLFYYSDANSERLVDFYNEEDNTLDAALLGASEVFFGYSPGLVYEKYDFTSYMYAINSNPGILYKPQLIDILQQQNPQIIFVETWGFLYGNEEELYNNAPLQVYAENTPFSLHKLNAILTHPYDQKLSCILPLIKYHKEWTDFDTLHYNFLKRMWDSDSPSLLKGMQTITGIYDPANDSELEKEALGYSLTPAAREYLIDFLEYCKQQDLDNLVFINFPRHINEQNDNGLSVRMEEAVALIELYGFEFINLQEHVENMNLDFIHDFYDAHHLNIYGQIKLSDYLGFLMSEEYRLTPMQQTSINKSRWDETVEYTNKYFTYADYCIQNEIKVSIGGDLEFLQILREWDVSEEAA